jgi:5-formyltetrahydrofolate cyclo-ligase
LRKSRLIAEQFWKLPVIQKARSILFYASMPGEVDTLAMIEKAFFWENG